MCVMLLLLFFQGHHFSPHCWRLVVRQLHAPQISESLSLIEQYSDWAGCFFGFLLLSHWLDFSRMYLTVIPRRKHKSRDEGCNLLIWCWNRRISCNILLDNHQGTWNLFPRRWREELRFCRNFRWVLHFMLMLSGWLLLQGYLLYFP